jgi:hypothetical protein
VAKVRLAAHGTLGELRARLTSATPSKKSFSRIEGFGSGTDRLSSTNEIIEIVDHPILHFLFEVRVCSSMIEPNPVFN